MDNPHDLANRFQQARQLHVSGRYAEAEQAYRQLATPGPHREPILGALTDLYLETGRADDAIAMLTTLTREFPDKLYYVTWLATLLDQWGHTDVAIEHYQTYLGRNPNDANAHFNLALLRKRQKRHTDALDLYQKALDLGIDNAQEVHSNIGLVHSERRDARAAEAAFKAALDIDQTYVPALFNYAGLCEETGRRNDAITLYRKILAIDPAHHESLSRLAYATRATGSDDPRIAELENAAQQAPKDLLVHEGLYFALGKLYDDCAEYDRALAAYNEANALGRKRVPRYDPSATARLFDELIERFDASWIERVKTDSELTPVFICGMFRSGSTLAEQLLGAHPEITPGGELDLLPWLIERYLSPYPSRASEATPNDIADMAREYDDRVRELLAVDGLVTDKRPDNFLHLGLVHAMFPQAKIVYTRRNPLDNCLSVYFQQLGDYLAYATDIESAAHYYQQHDKLMAHWQSLFGNRIHVLEYDELVTRPRETLAAALAFLGLAWDDRCLDPGAQTSMVKTASIWQVREPVHDASSGRHEHYRTLTDRIRPLFSDVS